MAKRRFHLGSTGKLTTKKLAGHDATKAAMAKLIAEKTRKGYGEVSAAKAKAASKKVVARAAPRAPNPPPTRMDDDGFWDILSRLNWKKQGDDDAVLAPAVKALSQMSVADIETFEVMMAKKLFALDTREHARAVYAGEVDPDDGDQYISADDFLYARCVMVVNGRKVYEAAVKDPTRMPKDSEFEAVLYLARDAYELKTGEELDVDRPVSYESFSNKAGWKRNASTKKGWATSARVPPGNRRPG